MNRGVERIGGVGFLLLGAWLIRGTWRVAAGGGRFPVIGAVMGPFAICVGVGLLLFPSPRSELAARGRDPRGRVGWADLSGRWRVVSGLAIASSLAWYLWLAYGEL